MFYCSCLNFYYSFIVFAVILNLLLISTVQTLNLKNSLPIQSEKLIKRFRRSDEYSSITDPYLLAKQYALVHKFRSIDILGAIHQYPSGKIDTRDFGQNIHYGNRESIRPGEKEMALQKLMEQAIEALLRMAQEII